jgi:hypothetical protein
MSAWKRLPFILLLGAAGPSMAGEESFPVPAIEFAPRRYICYSAPAAPVIDGRCDEEVWRQAAPTESFLDIEGEGKPAPRFHTTARMLWDSTYLYVAATLEEPDLWATLTARDAVIFHDHDFEIFIDPDGDTHGYYELEVNALNTVWDLLLLKPYRDGGPAVDAWDIQGLKTAVRIDGTLNQPGDRDHGWTVEIALPWAVLKQCAGRPAPPHDGDQWRINFSRVEWRTEVSGGAYRKVVDPGTGRPFPEDNWVWSPQGLIAMHYPEMWGFVQFSEQSVGDGRANFVWRPSEDAKWALRRIYYRQMESLRRNGRYGDRLEIDSKPPSKLAGYPWPPQFYVTPDLYELILRPTGEGGVVKATQDGRIWEEAPGN